MNKIIILVFVCVLLILLFLNIITIRETFSSDTRRFIFIDRYEAHAIIDSVSTFDRYNKLDLKLRNIENGSNIKTHYKKYLLDWQIHDKKIMYWLLEIVRQQIPEQYWFLFSNIKIAKFSDGIENDFPHTNKDTIFITNKFIEAILSYYNKKDYEGAIKQIGLVLIHECIHIWQRRDPDFFIELYKLWGFRYYKRCYNFKKIKHNSRYNPDGVELTWIYTSPDKSITIIPGALYKNTAKTIGDVNLVGIRCEWIGNNPAIPPIYKLEFLKDIKLFNDEFGGLQPNNYHPNEIAAEMISTHIIDLMYHLPHEERHSSISLQKYKTFFNRRY